MYAAMGASRFFGIRAFPDNKSNINVLKQVGDVNSGKWPANKMKAVLFERSVDGTLGATNKAAKLQ
jgi:hypothetical protein